MSSAPAIPEEPSATSVADSASILSFCLMPEESVVTIDSTFSVESVRSSSDLATARALAEEKEEKRKRKERRKARMSAHVTEEELATIERMQQLREADEQRKFIDDVFSSARNDERVSVEELRAREAPSPASRRVRTRGSRRCPFASPRTSLGCCGLGRCRSRLRKPVRS
jgi:hypothetical protein